MATLIAALLLGLSGARAVSYWLHANNESPQDEISISQHKTKSNNKKVDYKKLVKLHLLGEAEKKVKQTTSKQSTIKAPETSLNLKLIGVLFNRDNNDGYAIISVSGKAQKAYHKGDKVHNNATLYAVEQNRVILMRNGRHETLTLIKPDLKTLGASTSKQNLLDTGKRSQKKSTNNENILDAVRKSLKQSPDNVNKPGTIGPPTATKQTDRII